MKTCEACGGPHNHETSRYCCGACENIQGYGRLMQQMSATISLRLVADRLEAWAESAESNANSQHLTYAPDIQREKNKAENYRELVRYIRSAIDLIGPIEKCRDTYRQALDDILDPIEAIRRTMKPGYQLDGVIANSLAQSGSYLREIAQKAIEEARP